MIEPAEGSSQIEDEDSDEELELTRIATQLKRAPESATFVSKLYHGIQFFVALLGMACAGTLYAFGTYEEPLKVQMGLSQEGIQIVGYLGDAGLYLFGPVFGRLTDLLGPRLSNTLAAVNLYLGYGLMYGAISLGINSPIIVGLLFCLAGAGSGGLYISVLTTQVHLFDPAHRGLVVGILVSLYGLSAFIFTSFYALLFPKGPVEQFLLFMSGVTGGIAILAAFFSPSFQQFSSVNHQLQYNQLYDDEDSTPARRHESSRIEEGDAADGRVRVAPETSYSSGRSASYHPIRAQDEGVRSFTAVGWFVHLTTDRRFWISFWVLALGAGSGLVFINNTASIVKALNSKGGHNIHKESVVMMFSLMNCLGRAGAGFGSDAVPIRKAWWLVLQTGLMAGLYGMLAFASNPTTVVVGALGIGAAYGGLWAIFPLLVTDLFGMDSFGSTWGYMLLGPGGGGLCFNLLAGWFYDNAAELNEESDVVRSLECYGQDCYQSTFGFLSIACLVALILAFQLIPHTQIGRSDSRVMH
eukprot:CAMPEP_0196581676 /NCGR_PEP_ID=MMETSP1081-20130531/34955_1 /TAXON_ID=36882 /ORGANISM="Pyramimonas amylifera, Strain CCMP720" /LENGTH=525 /DNA_ID=CAMNT_0041901997 /DNA_START=224 /DNA_END=1801 /DNA_ORIENTATION=+